MNRKSKITASQVALVSIIGNMILSVLKLLAGIFANSGAMVSDAVHSASDVLSSIIVIIGVKISRKEADANHPYGHDRFEPVAAIVLAIILLVTGLFIGHTAIEKLGAGNLYSEVPGTLALAAALISIVCKEAMYWYTRFHAKQLNSGALMADAWHHRSDALSSVGALVGIAGARMGCLWLDAAASLVICLFIVKAAYDIFKDSINKLVDRACSSEIELKLLETVKNDEDVKAVESIHTRQFGNMIYVDVVILTDRNISLVQSDIIAQRVHNTIEEQFRDIKHITICVKPEKKIGELPTA